MAGAPPLPHIAFGSAIIAVKLPAKVLCRYMCEILLAARWQNWRSNLVSGLVLPFQFCCISVVVGQPSRSVGVCDWRKVWFGFLLQYVNKFKLRCVETNGIGTSLTKV